MLIAQYSGYGSYSQILQEVVPINLAYAQKWGHDFVTLEGTALQFPGLVYDDENQEGSTSNFGNNENVRIIIVQI